MIRSYLIVMFVMCFLFSMSSEAKLLTTKEVKEMIKADAAKKKQSKAVAQKQKKGVKAKSIAASKVKKNKAKKQIAKIGKSKKAKPVKVAKAVKKQSSARKVVRLDFDKKDSLKPKFKARKELKKLAKNEKSKKKSFKATQCADGHVVGHQAFCSTTAKAQLKKNKGRSIASKANDNKKLK